MREYIEQKYNRMKDEAAFPLTSLLNKKEYYQNQDAVNKVDAGQVEASFSSSRRDMMKLGLVQMAKVDFGQTFEADQATGKDR